MVEHGKVRYLAPLSLHLIPLALQEAQDLLAKFPEKDPASVVTALHSTQVCYFLGENPTGLGLLLGTSGHGQLLINTSLQQYKSH